MSLFDRFKSDKESAKEAPQQSELAAQPTPAENSGEDSPAVEDRAAPVEGKKGLFSRLRKSTGDEVKDLPAEAATVPPVSEPPLSPPEPSMQQPLPVEPAAEAVVPEPATPGASQGEEGSSDGLLSRLKKGLKRTSSQLGGGVAQIFLGKKEINDELLEELETQLLVADVGIEATREIIDKLIGRISRKELADAPALYGALKAELAALLKASDVPLQIDTAHKPYVILMVGVNGVGKTTTIGKLSKRFQAEGRSVMLAAGDTFRAAAVEQLQVWGERNDVPVVAQHTGADSASVIYDALQAAQSRNIDVLIADTAGRLHNKDNLMEELKKVIRVMSKLDASAPHEVMLVLDAGTGQNAMAQAKSFQQVAGVSGITLTKLDGTAKGGIIFAISKQLQLPIRFIGVGEQVDDLRPFVAKDFVEAVFGDQSVGSENNKS